MSIETKSTSPMLHVLLFTHEWLNQQLSVDSKLYFYKVFKIIWLTFKRNIFNPTKVIWGSLLNPLFINA